MDIQRFEIENITKSGFACVRDILTDRLLVTSDSCDLLNEQYQKILDLQSQLDQQKAMWNELKEWLNEKLEHILFLEEKCKDDLKPKAKTDKDLLGLVISKMKWLEQGEKDD